MRGRQRLKDRHGPEWGRGTLPSVVTGFGFWFHLTGSPDNLSHHNVYFTMCISQYEWKYLSEFYPNLLV